MRVKIIQSSTPNNLEEKINYFIKHKKVKVIDIKFEVHESTYAALVIYN